MKNNLLYLFCMLCCMTSCEKIIIEENSTPDSQLTILTRAGEEDGVVSYPLHVYIFKGEGCVAVQTLESSDDQLSLQLAEGTYSVCAIGGAKDTDYELPGQDAATPAGAVALKDGKKHADLMTASNTIALKTGQETQLALSMERKVAQLRTVTIQQLPEEATAVSVSFAPLYQHLCINGDYMGSSAVYEIALEKQENGTTWQNAGPEYILPSTDKATISIAITTPAGTKNYAYTCSEKLTANYIFDITGTYAGSSGVKLSGTFTGARWADTRTINFSFADNGGSGGSGGDPLTSIPSVGDFVKGCYVLAVSNATSTEADLVLLSPTEKNNIVTSSSNAETAQPLVHTALESWTPTMDSGWRVPTQNEVKGIKSKKNTINTALSGKGQNLLSTSGVYYCEDDGFLSTQNLSSGVVGSSFDSKTVLRPVADVHVTIE